MTRKYKIISKVFQMSRPVQKVEKIIKLKKKEEKLLDICKDKTINIFKTYKFTHMTELMVPNNINVI